MAMVSNATESAVNNNSHVDAKTDEQSIELYTENYNVWIKLIFILFGSVTLIVSTISITILQRTKRIPRSAKLLSRCLLVFDALYILLTCVRKFILDPGINLNLQVLSQLFVQWSYLTICIMAVDRLVVFNWPNYYMKHITTHVLHKAIVTLCLVVLLIYTTVRYIGCYLKYMSTIYLVQAGLCNEIMMIHYAAYLFIIVAISTVCYLKIFHIIKMKTDTRKHKPLSFGNITKELRGYKLTSIVLIYLMVIIVTTIGFVIIIFLRIWRVLGVTELRWAIEIVAFLNCFLDPFLYVIWFRESKMELLKLMCSWNTRFQEKLESMRIEIFCIVTNENCCNASSITK